MACSRFSVFFIILLISVANGVSSSCTWQLGDSCYHYVKHMEEFWAAEAYCSTIYNGHLMAIDSREENDFIMARLLETHELDGKIQKIVI